VDDKMSSRFVEWMMGLPDGWVTGVGLSRTQELKMLGNGVVPQQAAAAYGWLLNNEKGE
jgi:DNA (cytosine-5)-methyltransferase 1